MRDQSHHPASSRRKNIRSTEASHGHKKRKVKKTNLKGHGRVQIIQNQKIKNPENTKNTRPETGTGIESHQFLEKDRRTRSRILNRKKDLRNLQKIWVRKKTVRKK